MKQRGVSGTLHESGMQFLDQLVSAQGGVGVGGGEDSALTDVQYTQLMPQAGKSNNIICARHYW